MVKAGENEMRTDEKGMLVCTYKQIPNNDYEMIFRRGKTEDHMTLKELLYKLYGREVYVVIAH